MKLINENENKYVNNQVLLYKKNCSRSTPPTNPTVMDLEAKRVEAKAFKSAHYQDKRDNCMTDRECCPSYFVFVILGLPGANLSYLSAEDLAKTSGQPAKAKSKDGRHAQDSTTRDSTTREAQEIANANLLAEFKESNRVKVATLAAAAAADELNRLKELITMASEMPGFISEVELQDLKLKYMGLLCASLSKTLEAPHPYQTPIIGSTATSSTTTNSAADATTSTEVFFGKEFDEEDDAIHYPTLLVVDNVDIPDDNPDDDSSPVDYYPDDTVDLLSSIAAAELPTAPHVADVAGGGGTVEWYRGGGGKEKMIKSPVAPPVITKKRFRAQEQEPTKGSSGRVVKPKVIADAGQSNPEFCAHLFSIKSKKCPTCFNVRKKTFV